MNLITKLGIIGLAGAGIGAPTVFAVQAASSALGKQTGRVFNIPSPFLQSRSSKSSINLYLAVKENKESNGDRPNRLFWRVENWRDSRDQEFFNKNGKLVVYSGGNVRLKIEAQSGELSGRDTDIEFEEKNRFKIVGNSGDNGTKEVKLSDFKFKTTCNKWGDKKEECEIDIADSVGLKWADNIKPKVVFWD